MESLFFTTYGSMLESRLLNIPLTINLKDASHIVNPLFTILIGKTIIINLPLGIDITGLRYIKKVVSRFPIGGNSEVIPYEIPDSVKVEDDEYSNIILNKYMIDTDNPNEIIEMDRTNYLLGLETDIDGYLTAVGYKLMLTDLTKFDESSDSSIN